MSDINNFFTTLEELDKRTNIPSTISSPVWSGGSATLTAFYTSSAQSQSSGDYYYDVYDKAGTDATREVQFAVAYGHFDGSGSLSTSDGNNPSKAIYRQYRADDVRSKILQVHPLDWELAITVPTERFKTKGGGRTMSKKMWIKTSRKYQYIFKRKTSNKFVCLLI